MATVAFDVHTETGTVRLRVSHKSTRRFLSLGIQVNPSRWSNAKSRVTQSHREAKRINQRLSEIEQEARSVLARLQSRPEPITAEWLRDKIQSELEGGEDTPEGFMDFAWSELGAYKERGQTGTHKAYRSVLRKFEEYLERERGGTTLPFHRVTAGLFRGFRDFCYGVRGNATNTVGKALHIMRTFVRSAMREGYIDRADYPFEHITIDSEKVQKEKLTPEEIEKMASLELPVDSVIAEVRRWFLFSYEAGGMRFSDVATLRPEHIRDEGERRRVYYRMEKQSDAVGVPLTGTAEQILGYYDGPHGPWVFPILQGLGPDDDYHSRKESRNAMANDYLKKIARRVGIEKTVTFHLARNAAGWRLYKETDDIYFVSKVLGHASVSQTEEYLQGFEDDSADDRFLDAMG